MLMHSGVFREAFAEAFKDTPIDDWGYYVFNKKGEYFQAESNADFFNTFLENELYLEMPTKESNSAKYQFYSGIIEQDTHASSDLKRIARGHSFQSFVNVINIQGDYQEIFTFASSNQCQKAINYVVNHQSKMIELTKEIHDKLFFLFTPQNSIQLPKKLVEKIDTGHNEALHTAHDSYNLAHQPKEQLLETIHNHHSGGEFDFRSLPFALSTAQYSEKEREILYLLFHGFDTKETAKILEISPRTVERHFEKIRKKLGCKNKMQILHFLLRSALK